MERGGQAADRGGELPRIAAGFGAARAHGISRSLLTTWRRQFREGTLGADRQPSFAPVLMAPEVSSRAEPMSGADRIEIVLGNGRRLIVGAGIEAAALARIVAVLERA